MNCTGLHSHCAEFHAEGPPAECFRLAALVCCVTASSDCDAMALMESFGVSGGPSLLLVVLRYDKEVGNGANECASVLRDRLVAVEHDVEGNVGAVLGPRVVLVL